MANVKVFADKQTANRQTDKPKTVYPQSIDVGA